MPNVTLALPASIVCEPSYSNLQNKQELQAVQ